MRDEVEISRALETRMTRLERSTRTWQGVGTLGLLSCAFVLLVGWSPSAQKIPSEVESLTIKKDDKVRLKLSLKSKGPAIQIFGDDQKGDEDVARCEIRIEDQDAILHIGCKDNPRFDSDARMDPNGQKGGMVFFGTMKGRAPMKAPD